MEHKCENTEEQKPKRKETIHVIKDTFETVFGDQMVTEKGLKEFLGRLAVSNSHEFNGKGIILPPEFEYLITKDKGENLILLLREKTDE